MELEQWIQLFGAISSTATVREKSKWMMFCGGLIACTALLLTAFWALVNVVDVSACIGIGALGLLLASAWGVIQQRLVVESAHWNRILRSIESQFAGTELNRGIHRLLMGDQVCVPASAWVCGEWNPEAARFPALTRHVSSRVILWVPVLYVLAFVALVIATIMTNY
jgi:hypothetical protein